MHEYKPHPFVCTGSYECGGTHSHAGHSADRDFPELSVYSRRSLGLVNLGFHFARVGMRYLEVAWVSTSLTPWFAQVPLSAVGFILTHATPAALISRGCASIPEFP